jgi:hypothetical protein
MYKKPCTPLVSSSSGAHVILISCDLSLFSIDPRPFLCMGKKFRPRRGRSSRFSKTAPQPPTQLPPPASAPAHCSLLATPAPEVACPGPLVTPASTAPSSSSLVTPAIALVGASLPGSSFPDRPVASLVHTHIHSSSPAKDTSTALIPSRPPSLPHPSTRHLNSSPNHPSPASPHRPFTPTPPPSIERLQREYLKERVAIANSGCICT